MSLIVEFEFSYLPPSVNILYCRTRSGGLYLHPKVLSFKTNVHYILKNLQFNKSNKDIKIEIQFYVKRKNIDCDNLLKVLIDSMNKIVFDDDRQVFELNVKKIIDKDDRTYVKIYEMDT